MVIIGISYCSTMYSFDLICPTHHYMKNGDNNDSDDDDEDDGGGIAANYQLWDERNAETVVTLVSGSADGHWDQIGEADFARDKKGGMANVFFSDGIEALVFSIHIKALLKWKKARYVPFVFWFGDFIWFGVYTNAEQSKLEADVDQVIPSWVSHLWQIYRQCHTVRFSHLWHPLPVSRCPAHKRGDRGSSSKEFPVSPPCPQFCHVRSTLVSLDSGHRVPGHQVLQHLASKRPPSVGQEGAGPGDRGEGGLVSVSLPLSNPLTGEKDVFRWHRQEPAHVLGKCWQDRWKKTPQVICKHIGGV